MTTRRRKQQDPLQLTAVQVRDYSTGARNACRETFIELSEAIPELRKALRPIIGWRRTAMVLIPLRIAAEMNKHASAHAAASWFAFLKNFFADQFGNLRKGRRS